MGVFDDKKFESLDWISQATEPIDSKLNETLGNLPEEVIIDFNTYREMVGDSYSMDLSLDRAVSYITSKHGVNDLSWEDRSHISKCFQFEIGSDVELNFETRTLTGELKLIKVQSTMDEKILKDLLGREGIMAASQMYIRPDGMSRANDVMELLGKCEQGLKTRSARNKRHIIKQRLIEIFKNNEWNIRDTELANKVGRWITAYIMDSNLAAWSNFCRLKVMTHKNQPIYSMEEVQ